MESWLSGRKHLTANEAGSKSPHGFKSHTLRKARRNADAFRRFANEL